VKIREEKLSTKVSVCIGTFNQKEYIGDCIRTVLMQIDESISIEILVGDDASTDGTSDVVRQFAKQYPGIVIPHIHAKNIGAAKNYQHLVAAATGDFIAHLDGDDYWLPGKIRAQVQFLLENSDCSVVFSNAVVVDGSGLLLGGFSNSVPVKFNKDYLLREGNFLNYSSMLYRARCRHVLLELVPPFIDFRMHLHLSECGFIGWIESAYVVYRAHTATSLIRNSRDNVRSLGWDAIVEAMRMPGISPGAKADAIAIFLVPVVFQSIRRMRFRYLTDWMVAGIRLAVECSVLVGFVGSLFFRIGRHFVRGALHSVGGRLNGNFLRIFYRR
jgi:glycosyltransferase involved in cell wall biosynthesis